MQGAGTEALGEATGVLVLGGRVGAPDLPCLCSAASDAIAEHNGGVGAVRKKITMH